PNRRVGNSSYVRMQVSTLRRHIYRLQRGQCRLVMLLSWGVLFPKVNQFIINRQSGNKKRCCQAPFFLLTKYRSVNIPLIPYAFCPLHLSLLLYFPERRTSPTFSLHRSEVQLYKTFDRLFLSYTFRLQSSRSSHRSGVVAK